MYDEYYINADTLLIMPLNKTKTKIYDITGIYIIKKSVFDIVENSCQYYGSSYSGRYIGAKKLLDMDYKLPIIVDEVKEIIIFPTCSPRSDNCYWICINNIDNYEKLKRSSRIKFINGSICELPISYNSLENQIMRATMLVMRLKRRKSESKKLV